MATASAPAPALERASRFFDTPLLGRPRLLALLAALALIGAFVFPLWELTMYSNQFPDGLDLYIYSYKLDGGHPPGRDDLKEINTLNHYIGMRPLLESDFAEFGWMPLVLGAFVILTLRTVVIGKMANLVDNFVMFLYFGLFSLWSFYHRLFTYGHNLDYTEAPVRVPPFMPPMFGSKQLANFTVYSYPGAAAWFLVAFAVLLAAAIWLARPRRQAAA